MFWIEGEKKLRKIPTILLPYICSNNYRRFSGLEQHKLILLQYWRSEI